MLPVKRLPGNLNQEVKVKGIAELERLADTFNYMESQMKSALQTLENRVQERTKALVSVNQKLEALVNLDGLTQIANRRCFDHYLALEWPRHQREQQPLSLIMIDIDYFKGYNDFYGHQSGDDCLVQVAQMIVKVLQRPTDLVARYGGEEFAVILSNTDSAGALTVATAMETAIATVQIPHQASEVSNVITLSMGVTSLIPKISDNLDLIISQADQALYAAKQAGRHRILSYRQAMDIKPD
ncbi:MAG: diguanylate cyclase [Acaryochloridaceae cyanobacterium SU_2_1]|nr:diguanylate cyclase [Acaryochloridaceae cyanobacterium SU_2_1]